jgi:hypothetical protein
MSLAISNCEYKNDNEYEQYRGWLIDALQFLEDRLQSMLNN